MATHHPDNIGLVAAAVVVLNNATSDTNNSRLLNDTNITELYEPNSGSGSEALDGSYQIYVVALYSLTATFALVSNLITLIVLIKGKRSPKDLRKFLINLCCADVLMAIFTIPFTYTNYMLGKWIFFPIMCPIVNAAQLTTITVSVYTLVAIAIDRYFAVMHPLQKSKFWFKQHRSIIVCIVWALGAAMGSSQLYIAETITYEDNQKRPYLYCAERWSPESLESQVYTIFIFLTTFGLPMVTLCVIYSAMGWRLFKYRMPGSSGQGGYSSSTALTPGVDIICPTGHVIPTKHWKQIDGEPSSYSSCGSAHQTSQSLPMCGTVAAVATQKSFPSSFHNVGDIPGPFTSFGCHSAGVATSAGACPTAIGNNCSGDNSCSPVSGTSTYSAVPSSSLSSSRRSSLWERCKSIPFVIFSILFCQWKRQSSKLGRRCSVCQLKLSPAVLPSGGCVNQVPSTTSIPTKAPVSSSILPTTNGLLAHPQQQQQQQQSITGIVSSSMGLSSIPSGRPMSCENCRKFCSCVAYQRHNTVLFNTNNNTTASNNIADEDVRHYCCPNRCPNSQFHLSQSLPPPLLSPSTHLHPYQATSQQQRKPSSHSANTVIRCYRAKNIRSITPNPSEGDNTLQVVSEHTTEPLELNNNGNGGSLLSNRHPSMTNGNNSRFGGSGQATVGSGGGGVGGQSSSLQNNRTGRRMHHHLNHYATVNNSHYDQARIISLRRIKVLKMLIAIITAFALCWLPIQIFQLVVYFSPNILANTSDIKYYTFVGTYFVCHWISMAHSFMNPIIYSFMSKSFKDDMHNLFANCRWRKKKCTSRKFFSGMAPILGVFSPNGASNENGHIAMAVYHNDPSLPDEFQNEIDDDNEVKHDRQGEEEEEEAYETNIQQITSTESSSSGQRSKVINLTNGIVANNNGETAKLLLLREYNSDDEMGSSLKTSSSNRRNKRSRFSRVSIEHHSR